MTETTNRSKTAMAKTTFILDSNAFDQQAEAVARGEVAIDSVPESVLIHAARYRGNGWSPERRKEIVAAIRKNVK